MSIESQTYLGPYFYCETEEAEAKREIRTCSNPTCRMYEVQSWDMQIKFCNQCAYEIKNREISYIAKNVDHNALRQEMGQRLAFPGGDTFAEWMRQNNCHIWFPNVGEVGNWLEINSEMYLIPIAADKIRVENGKFLKFFEKELSLLKERYGEKKVKWHWGVINYFS